MSEAMRFRFDFADLHPPVVDLKVLEGGVPVPDQAVAVPAHPRPGWLRPLLPIFSEGRTLRLVNGSLPRLERALGLPAATVVRLPLVGSRELSTAVRGLPAALGSRRFGRACLALAGDLCRRYREALP